MVAFLKDSLTKSGFNVNEISKNILVINNFISKEESQELLKIINNTPEEEWHIEYTRNLARFCMQKFGRDDVDNLVSEGKFEITKGWQDKNLDIHKHSLAKIIKKRMLDILNTETSELELSGLTMLQRMQEGVELKCHTDQHTDPSIRYATILYLNDNYEGGELFFKNVGLEIKPEKGSLIIFPGTEEFSHGVNAVKSGPIRYVIVGFIKEKDFYKNNKY
jgi:Rps23 Pro-64 3,4-dihydroxylase Tpa1-like proline 4-hydroxylase